VAEWRTHARGGSGAVDPRGYAVAEWRTHARGGSGAVAPMRREHTRHDPNIDLDASLG
jgi:hypothetical protein